MEEKELYICRHNLLTHFSRLTNEKKFNTQNGKNCNFVGGIMEKVWAEKREKRILISSLPINSLCPKQVAWSSVLSFLQGSVWIYQQFIPA